MLLAALCGASGIGQFYLGQTRRALLWLILPTFCLLLCSLAFEDIEENLPLPRSLVGHGDLIALRVRGDSMIGAGINHGDVVVIRKQCRVESGENAAAMIRDEVTGDFEATVKEYRVYDGHAWLMPRNPAYPPIPGDNGKIIGKVTAVLRGGL